MTTPRHILITGSSRGLGLALAEHFLAAGDEVMGCSRGAAALDHPHYHHVCLDVCDDQAVVALFRTVHERWGGLDALINNAGAARMTPVALMPPRTARQIMDINFMGAFLPTHQAIRLLRHSSAGRIVNLTSIAVPLRLEGEAVYAAAKAAVESFTRTLAREIGPLGITVNAVGPSPIRTDLIAKVPPDKLDALIRRQAIPIWAQPTDVVNVVDFFLRPQSNLITGQVVYLGGFG